MRGDLYGSAPALRLHAPAGAPTGPGHPDSRRPSPGRRDCCRHHHDHVSAEPSRHTPATTGGRRLGPREGSAGDPAAHPEPGLLVPAVQHAGAATDAREYRLASQYQPLADTGEEHLSFYYLKQLIFNLT